jgi:hypothetical protein
MAAAIGGGINNPSSSHHPQSHQQKMKDLITASTSLQIDALVTIVLSYIPPVGIFVNLGPSSRYGMVHCSPFPLS